MNAFWRVFATILVIAAAAILCLITFRIAVETGLWPPKGWEEPTPDPKPGADPLPGEGGSIARLPVESGSMPIGGLGGVTEEPTDEAAATLPAEVPDPCPPVAAPGFITGTLVYAINQVRLYTKPDNESPSVAEYSSGQSLVVTPDLDGTTAITRCGTLWVLVMGPSQQIGWVLGAAVSVDPIHIVTPNPCPGGCATPVPPCVQPCPNPCPQPCPNPCPQPCWDPCTQPCWGLGSSPERQVNSAWVRNGVRDRVV